LASTSAANGTGTPADNSAGGPLAFTGASLVLELTFALLALAAGLVMTGLAHRRRTARRSASRR
jgi:hypothetical protein